MANNAFNSLREFKLKSGKTGKFYSLAALEKAGVGKVSRLPVSHPHGARIGAAQLRRQARHRRPRAGTGELEAERAAHGGDPVRASRASCCRTSPACRCWWTWPRCASPARHGQEPEGHRAAGAGGPGRRPLGAGGLLRHAGRAATRTWRWSSSATASVTSSSSGACRRSTRSGRAAGHRHRATR